MFSLPQAEAAHQQAEDTRRLAHRAISYRPASHVSVQNPSLPVIKPMMLPPAPTRSPHHPSLTSHASSSSSGVSSLQSYRAESSTSPTSSLDMMTSLTIQVGSVWAAGCLLILQPLHAQLVL